METIKKEALLDGVNLTCITTDKFTTSCVSVNVLVPMADADCTKTALIPRVLRQGTAKYPKRELIDARLDELFGARIEGVVRKKGETLAIGFLSDVIDEKYAMGGDKLTVSTVQMLTDLLFNPVLENGIFNSEYVESEKANLKDKIEAQINDKRTYAVTRMYQLMCDGEAFGKNRLGNIEDIPSINAENLYHEYRKLLRSCEIQLYYCGSMCFDDVKTAFMQALRGLERELKIQKCTVDVKSTCGEPRYITENVEATQGKLAIGFRTGITAADKDYPAMILFNTIFGSSTSSKLFVNVREKLSLCYYASSQTEKLKGVMAVSSGIENDKYEVAKDAILKQFEDIKSGNITEEEVLSAKKTITGSLQGMKDSPISMDDFYLGQSIAGLEYNIDFIIDSVNKTSKEEIITAANKVQLDTVYFLKGGEQ